MNWKGRERPARPAVFLDRDGVLNRAVVRDGKPFPPSGPAELEILPDVPSALARLKQSGFFLVVITNQPDVARGTQTKANVEAIHGRLRTILPLDDILVCYHDDPDDCDCRKPRPGLLMEAAKKHDLRLLDSFLIGDRWRDIEAGFNAGVRTVLIDYHYRERSSSHEPDARAASLTEAAAWILRETERKHEPL